MFKSAVFVAVLLVTACTRVQRDNEEYVGDSFVQASNKIEAGRYLITTAGCNDCHTDGFMQDPTIPESEWLTGSTMGWQGPWGTTYPANLRLSVQKMTEDQWVTMLKIRKGMPPMPWPSVNNLSESDSRAMYAYIQSLGPKGDPTPLPVAPGVEPKTPYLSMMPHNVPVAVASD